MKSVVIFLLFALLSGCEVIQDALLDCIDADGPEFNTDAVPHAILNQEYSVTIIASIDNEPNDSWYKYSISLNGDLPAGLSIIEDNDDRTITIAGTPTESGSFTFTLSVYVDEPEDIIGIDYETGELGDDSNLCFNSHNQEYTLTVDIT